MKHASTLTRAQMAQKIAAQHYEAGVQSKSLHAVWKHFIKPQMGVCYATFLAYLKM